MSTKIREQSVADAIEAAGVPVERFADGGWETGWMGQAEKNAATGAIIAAMSKGAEVVRC